MKENASTEEYLEDSDFERAESSKFQAFSEKLLESRYFWVILILLVSISSFLLGQISKIEQNREPVVIWDSGLNTATLNQAFVSQKENFSVPSQELENSQTGQNDGMIVASKNGTKYHYPWCAGAKKIAEKNKIFFKSVEEAKAKGYTRASNCKGLK
jgi:hypothetical protein